MGAGRDCLPIERDNKYKQAGTGQNRPAPVHFCIDTKTMYQFLEQRLDLYNTPENHQSAMEIRHSMWYDV